MTVKELKELLEGLHDDAQINFWSIEDNQYYSSEEMGSRAGYDGQKYFLWGYKE